MTRVIHLVSGEPPDLPDPSPDVAYGYHNGAASFDRPSRLPKHRRPRMRVTRPEPGPLKIRVQRVPPTDWDDNEEDQ